MEEIEHIMQQNKKYYIKDIVSYITPSTTQEICENKIDFIMLTSNQSLYWVKVTLSDHKFAVIFKKQLLDTCEEIFI